ncbi:unknown protein [Seminavis robusta]|uniref:CRESS-DNA virus Rep endonuclease domain-containing protein n=1 Tax=Seminavis robusta TaxID=568900 RepID=A0A9N8E8X8_9STRA|nr:unknown protein [Seminavis robusta]|eukprot:Sro802_g204650.1 n/a (361) ;mRNA; r:21260-22342
MPPTYNPSGRKFVFTLHNWTNTDWSYLKNLCETRDDLTFMKVAQENGKEESPHLQGCVVFDRNFKQRESKVSKILMGPNKDTALPDPNKPGQPLGHHYHVKVMQGTFKQAADYCGNLDKEGECPIYVYGTLPDSVQGERTDFKAAQTIIKEKAKAGCKLVGPDGISELLPRFWAQHEQWVRSLYTRYLESGTNFFENNTLFKWQQDLVSYLNDHDPDPRKILFIVDEKGNGGKSELVRNKKWLFPGKDVFTIPPKDTVSMASLFPDNGTDIVLFDCPRKKQHDLAYDFLENLKDGRIVQTKYQPITKTFPIPHVVILMNRIPRLGKSYLSADRYIIKEIELEPEESAKLEAQQADTLQTI